MKKVILGLVTLVGIASATPSFAQVGQAPVQATPQSFGGQVVYVCPPGWQLVTQPQLVTYSVPTGRYLTVPIYGLFGRIRGYQQVPEMAQVTTFVNANFCVPGGVVFLQ